MGKRVPIQLTAEADCPRCGGTGWWRATFAVSAPIYPGQIGSPRQTVRESRDELCGCVRTALEGDDRGEG